MRIALAVPFVLLAACGGGNSACLAYTDSNAACINEAEAAGLAVDVDLSDPEGFCDSMDKTDEEWACLSAAYDDGDCTTDEGLAAILVEADAC